MKIKKRMLCLTLVALLAFGGLTPLFGQGKTEQFYDKLIKKYASMLSGNGKAQSAGAFYTVKDALRKAGVSNKIVDSVSKMTRAQKARLYNLGFGGGSAVDSTEFNVKVGGEVHGIYLALLDMFPSENALMKSDDGGTTFFEYIYDKGGELSSSDYPVLAKKFKAESKKVYAKFPAKFKEKLDKAASSKGKEGVDVFVEVYGAVADEPIGDAKIYYDSANNKAKTEVTLKSGSNTEGLVNGVLSEYMSANAASDMAKAYVSIFDAALVAISEATEIKEVLGKGDNLDKKNVAMLTLLTNLQSLKIVSESKPGDQGKDDDYGGDFNSGGSGGSGGSSSSGGGSKSSPSTPPTPPVPPKTVPSTPGGAIDVDKVYASANMEAAKALEKTIAQKPAKEAIELVKSAVKNLDKEADEKNINAKEAADMAKAAARLLTQLLKNDKITVDQAVESVNSAINTVFEQAVQRDTVGAERRELNAVLVNITKEVIRKAGRIESKETMALTKASVKSALDASTQAANKMVAQMRKNGLTQASQIVKPIVFIDFEGSGTLKKAALDKESIQALNDKSAELEVNLGGVHLAMNSSMLKEVKETGLTLENKALSAKEKASISGAKTEEGRFVNIASEVYEIDLLKGSNSIGIIEEDLRPQIMIETPKGAKNPVLSVFDEEEKEWEILTTKEIDGLSVAFAPHFSKYAVLDVNVGFSDVNGHWAQKTIEMMTANNITKGRTKTAFEPDRDITRAEFAAYLVNLIGLEGKAKTNFADVSEDEWYYNAVGLAGSNGLVSGVGDGKFAPEASVSRQDMAVMMAKAYAMIKKEPLKGNAKAFVDNQKISGYAKYSVTAARYQKLISGFEDGTFRPKKTATRAEATQMLKNLLEKE